MKHKGPHTCHECAPKDWRKTPDLTGSHELDAVIMHSKNPNVPDRLKMFMENENAYGARTGYDGYHNYGGDS